MLWAGLAAWLWPAPPALADELDLALSRLSEAGPTGFSREQACDATRAEASAGGTGLILGDDFALVGTRTVNGEDRAVQMLQVDRDAWASLISQLGPALFSPLLEPVTTSGPRGLDMGLDFNFTGIDNRSTYWRRGTRGSGTAAVITCEGDNRFVPTVIRTNRLRFSKGLPFGFELGSSVGRLWQTSLWLLGVELKWALFEGYRTWPLPDLAVRGSVTTSVGDPQYTLTTVTADVVLSKPFVAGRVMRVVPFVAGQMGFIFAASELVDLTPNIDATNCQANTDPHCVGMTRPVVDSEGNVVGQADGSDHDLGHDRPFPTLALRRYRGTLGLQLRYQMFTLTGEFTADLVPPNRADSDAPESLPRQWSVNFAPAVSY